LKFAAIDIGSNAVRLLFCHVSELDGETRFKKNSLIRVPIRLGEDSFSEKKISEKNATRLLKTMQAFKLLIDVHEPISFRACATSAMREATNGNEIVEKIARESGITIEIVSGKKEAEIIYSNHIEEHLEEDKAYLYIDVGGGSTELTLFRKRRIVASTSFNIGTIRILKQQVDKAEWEYLYAWISSNVSKIQEPIFGIGSGGNINKIHSMAGKKSDKPVSYERIAEIYNDLKKYTYQQRIDLLGLNPDRADVIVPACEIFLNVMKHASVKKIYVPEIGLSDGIVHLLYEEHKRSLSSPLFI
jgi:exopolyphosphatase/guanosine-5'-triphosphate,3'-diphosphate pyrophosphatase